MTDFYDINTRNRESNEKLMDFEDWFYGNKQKNKMEKFWVCWVAGTDGGKHYHHWTLASAQREAERLAKLPDVQGKSVYLFECVGKCHAELMPVKWEVPR